MSKNGHGTIFWEIGPFKVELILTMKLRVFRGTENVTSSIFRESLVDATSENVIKALQYCHRKFQKEQESIARIQRKIASYKKR